MCTTYGNRVSPACKAYQGGSKNLLLTDIASSVNETSSDKIFIGDANCGFDGYLSHIIIAKDGNLIDGKIFYLVGKNPYDLVPLSSDSCQFVVSIDSSSQFCLQCPSSQMLLNGTCVTTCGPGFLYNAISKQCYCPSGYYINGNTCSGKFIYFYM